VIDRQREVLARVDGGDILEDVLRTQVSGKRVTEAAGVSSDVGPSVAQEDLDRPLLSPTGTGASISVRV
jgi:hypothetical protein